MKSIPGLSLLIIIGTLSGCSTGNNQMNDSSPISDSLILESVFPLQEQHCHGSSIVELPNKDLLVAWFQGSGERTADDVVCLLYTSDAADEEDSVDLGG